MDYILIEIDTLGQAYQVVQAGNVMKHVDLNGVDLFKEIPIGLWSKVIDAAPPRQPWMI